MQKPVKPLDFVGPARKELQGFPKLARGLAGLNLFRVQEGREPKDWKPLEEIGPGACKIRVRSVDGGTLQHRVVYVAKFPEAVYVLHAFEKRTQQISTHHLEVAAAHYTRLLRARHDAGK
jgi:phage-related protein